METNALEREVMLFILNGRTFDTATATPAAVRRGAFVPDDGDIESDYSGAEQVRYENTLYRTAKGNFFLHEHRSMKFPKGKPVIVDHAREFDPEEAVRWIRISDAAILDGAGLPLPDEA